MGLRVHEGVPLPGLGRAVRRRGVVEKHVRKIRMGCVYILNGKVHCQDRPDGRTPLVAIYSHHIPFSRDRCCLPGFSSQMPPRPRPRAPSPRLPTACVDPRASNRPFCRLISLSSSPPLTSAFPGRRLAQSPAFALDTLGRQTRDLPDEVRSLFRHLSGQKQRAGFASPDASDSSSGIGSRVTEPQRPPRPTPSPRARVPGRRDPDARRGRGRGRSSGCVSGWRGWSGRRRGAFRARAAVCDRCAGRRESGS